MFNKIMKELEGLKGQWSRVKAKTTKSMESAKSERKLHSAHRKAGVAAEPRAEFIPNPYAEHGSVSREGEIRTSFASLKKKLGNPISYDDDKVSTMWVMEDPRTGAVITVYDYKLTSLYDEDLPSVAELRKKKSVEWSVGARDKKTATRFLTWLRKQR